MKVLGYCDSCRRFKYVRVSGHGMAMLASTRVAHGTCDACEEKAEADRRKLGRR